MKPNPYSLAHPWNDEVREAHAAMPQYGGYVVALDYVKPRDIPEQESQWREWCKQFPRHLWPTWLEGWKDRRNLRLRA